MRIKILLSVLVGLLLINLSYAQQISFFDVASTSGITHPPSYIRGGISFFDFNNDGYDDISFSSEEGENIYLFKNNSNFFSNMVSQTGILDTVRSRMTLWWDYDNDGDNDIFVCNEGASNRLFNNNGDMTFTDVTEAAGFPIMENSTNCVAAADYNNDGWLDIYVTNYSEFQRNYLFKNNGDGTFSDVTMLAGVDDKLDSTYYRLPFAVSFLDYNKDGWQDIYIANDHFTDNTLYKNNGDGTFDDVSEESHAGGEYISGFMMGIAIGDYDNNGYLDIYTCNDPFGNYLLKNNGDGTFTEVAEELNLAVNKSCWGATFFDYDNDTDLDLYVCVESGAGDKRNPFFKNNGDGTFERVMDIGMEQNFISYSSAVGDFDNNGFLDLAVYNNQANHSLYRNSANNGNNWIKIDLVGTESNIAGIGSMIEFYVDGEKFIRSTHCGISYIGQNSKILTVGIGQANKIDSIKVIWPSRIIDTYKNVNSNQILTCTEGETLTDLKEVNNKPDNFTLFQNYPNPFNPSTKIEFSIPEESNVKIDLFNIIGELIGTIYNKQIKSGKHSFNFNPKNLNSGIYFYKLSANTSDGEFYTEIKKMVFLK